MALDIVSESRRLARVCVCVWGRSGELGGGWADKRISGGGGLAAYIPGRL